MSSFDFYAATLIVIFGVDLLGAWALNMQYGFAGIPNFAFILFQAIGAYAAAVTSLGPTNSSSYQTYLFGARLPFPVPLLVAAVAGALLAALIGTFSLRRMRVDYQAAILLIVSLIVSQVVTADTTLFNGSLGLTNIPRPFASLINPTSAGYEWAYGGLVWVLCALVMLICQRLAKSPWGRALRAQRDHDAAAASLGLNVTALRMQVFVIGGAIAGLSGGLLVYYLQAWSPASWGYEETFAIFVSVIVGGVGNNWGVILGTFLVQIVFVEVPTLLPQFGYLGLVNALEWVVIGVLWLACIGFRPQGLLPERRLRSDRLAARFGARPGSGRPGLGRPGLGRTGPALSDGPQLPSPPSVGASSPQTRES